MAKVSVDLDIGFKPQGPRNADIVLVIDRPCSVKHKKWLKGSESRLLDSMLRGVGINMHKCYRTVVYKEKKITNKKDQWYQLRMELKRVNPNVIITLGNEPLRAVTQKESISCFDYRGSILGSDCGKVIPTYTPNYIMSQFGDNPIMQLDLARAKRESKTPELNLPERELITNPTMSEIKEFIDHCRLKEFLSFDIETIKGNSENYKYIDCIGLAPTPELSMCIPFCYANGKNLWSIEQEIEIYHMLANLMSIKEIKKIAQNAQFDVSHLEDRGIPVRNLYFDTMNAAKVIEPEFPKGLDFLVSIYTREPYYKDQSEDNRWIYNAKDSACTLEVCEGQIKDLERKGLKDFYFDHVHPLIRCFINVSRQGVNHDEEKMAQLDAEIDKIIEKKRQKLTDILGKRINVKSVIDMRQVLYQDYGMKPRYNKNGNLCTAKETLEEFYRRTGDEAFQLMLDIRKYRSKSSGFTKTEISEDGRIRTSYIVSGTESGRLSSKKYVDGTGMNCQNREKGIEREIFIPDPGMIFVGADLGQAENRVVAYAADDQNMIDVVESGGDVHRENAAMIFDKSFEEVTNNERQLGKRITHACVTPGHEVLTLTGWKKIEEINSQEIVAQVDLQNPSSPRIRYDNAKKLHFEYSGKLHQIENTSASQIVTSDHRIPYVTAQGNPLHVKTFAEGLHKTAKLLTNGEVSNFKINKEKARELRLAIAIQADATFRSNNTMEFHLKNMKKINRLKSLLGDDFNITEYSDGTTSIKIRKENLRYIEDFIHWNRDKTFKWHLTHLSLSYLKIIEDEVSNWDGTQGGKSGHAKTYSSTNKENAKIIQTITHLMGKQALLSELPQRGNRKTVYRLTFNNRKLSSIQHGTIQESNYNGDVFCLKTNTGFFLIKHNDKISITGNCNYCMGPMLFAKLANISVAQAKEYQRRYFNTYPRVRVWQKEIEVEVRKTRKLVTPFGRERTFHGRMNDDTFRSAVSYIPQSTVADKLHFATQEIWAQLPHPARIILQLHDEIFIQCLPEQFDEISIIIEEALTRPFEINGYTVSIPTEIKRGYSWNEVS